MSERGSLITDFIYCHKCFKAMRDACAEIDKLSCDDVPHGIIGGRLSASYAGEEADMWEYVFEKLKLCHRVRVAIMCDSGRTVIATIGPDGYDIKVDILIPYA